MFPSGGTTAGAVCQERHMYAKTGVWRMDLIARVAVAAATYTIDKPYD